MRISELTRFQDLSQVAPNSLREVREQPQPDSSGKVFFAGEDGEVVAISHEAYEELKKAGLFNEHPGSPNRSGGVFLDTQLEADFRARMKLYESGNFTHSLSSGTSISMTKESEDSYLATIKQADGQEKTVQISGNTRISEREDGSIEVVRGTSGSTLKGSSGNDFIVSFDAHVEAGDGDDFIYQARKSGQNVGLRLSGGA